VSTLIVGCGYLSRAVAARLLRRGEAVLGTVRSGARAEELERRGITPLLADVLRPESLRELPACERVLYAVGFDRAGGGDMRRVYVEGLSNVLRHLPGTATRLVYASSTSVFGQASGEWVTEESRTEPWNESGRICLEAEETLRAWSGREGRSIVTLRFSGLYGPGRVIRRALVERGEPVPGDPEKYLNLVQIDDAARAAVAAMLAERAEPLYLVSDDRPVKRREYYELVSRLLQAPAPRFEPSPDPASRRADEPNRRICNRLLREGLGVCPAYPDITSGVPAALGLPR
jgi:nucleoside-diphosphate-sugar epimerase